MTKQLIVQIPQSKVDGGRSTGRRANLADQINVYVDQGWVVQQVLPIPIFGQQQEYLIVLTEHTP